MSFQTRSQRDSTFQSTHPRGVRLVRGLSKAAIQQVSIHAPAWGATRLALRRLSAIAVSIHAPAWGATGLYPAVLHADVVSIHAPAWGATYPAVETLLQIRVSIHAPAWGATGVSITYIASGKWFQSTHPRGVRPGKILSLAVPMGCFNPRTRVGCDAPARGRP